MKPEESISIPETPEEAGSLIEKLIREGKISLGAVEKIILALRREIKEKAEAAVEKEKEEAGVDKDVRLERWWKEYQDLSLARFEAGSKPEWKAILAKLTQDVLGKLENLGPMAFYGMNKEGELLIGDYRKEAPPIETFGQDYFEARGAALKKGLTFMSEDEYIFFNKATFETASKYVGWDVPPGTPPVLKNVRTWLESGDAPLGLALTGCWNGEDTDLPRKRHCVYVGRFSPACKDGELQGARRVFRVKIF